MAAVYGTGSIKTSFGAPRVDLQSVVVAEDVNPVYDEIVAIEKFLGADVHKRTDTWTTGTFSTQATAWSDLKARINNIENGVISSVRVTGGSVIQNSTSPAGTPVTGATLTLKAASGQASNALEVKSSTDALLASISADGKLQAVSIDGGNAASASNAGA